MFYYMVKTDFSISLSGIISQNTIINLESYYFSPPETQLTEWNSNLPAFF